MQTLFAHPFFQKYPFTTQTVMRFFDIGHQHAIQNIFYRVKKGKITRLQKNLFLLMPPSHPNITDIVANTLVPESYISCETVLSRHSIIPDIPRTVTSICKGNKKMKENQLGKFLYQSIKTDCFFGFEVVDEAFVASPEKALLDYLYLTMKKVSLSRSDSQQQAYEFFMSQRLANLHELDREYLMMYVNKFKKKKLSKIIQHLVSYKDSPVYEQHL